MCSLPAMWVLYKVFKKAQDRFPLCVNVSQRLLQILVNVPQSEILFKTHAGSRIIIPTTNTELIIDCFHEEHVKVYEKKK